MLATAASDRSKPGCSRDAPRSTAPAAVSGERRDWQLVHNGDLTIVDKNGGLSNTSTYVGFIPQERLGIVILASRGGVPAARIGRRIMLALVRGDAAVPGDDRAALDRPAPIQTRTPAHRSTNRVINTV